MAPDAIPRRPEKTARPAPVEALPITADSIQTWPSFPFLDALAAGLPELPPLPTDFSRTDIYGEHE